MLPIKSTPSSLCLFAYLLIGLGLLFRVEAYSQQPNAESGNHRMETNLEKIVVGGGCFWCMEAVFQSFRGVEGVVSGYAGGKEENPTYHQVGSGKTGHAEVVQIAFNPKQISLHQLLTIFFHAHDPTTQDKQGNDVGPQYRSIILYDSEAQKIIAEKVLQEVKLEKLWGEATLTTTVEPLTKFYRAEEYHQDYFKQNPSQGYCLFVVAPKVKKIREQFKDLLKD